MKFKKLLQLINEGGAGGHIIHPFGLDTVQTGKDLINIFNQIVKSIKNTPPQIKIDGINGSIKLIEKNGQKQFAIDRGSKKQIDIDGVTQDQLKERFGDDHIFLDIGKKELNMFNQCIEITKPELKKLGLWDDPTKLFNVEIVYNKGNKFNLIQYNGDFFLINGVIQIPIDTRKSSPIYFDKTVMNEFIKKCKPIFKENGFFIYGPEYADVKTNIDFTETLKKPITINWSKGNKETKSLEEWLNQIKKPKYSEQVTVKGEENPVGCISQKSYLYTFEKEKPLEEIIEEKNKIEKFVNGAIFYLATSLLGNVIKEASNSNIGHVKYHEGLIIIDDSISKDPIKITGDYLIKIIHNKNEI